MKNYKDCEKKYIGTSDVAMLLARTPKAVENIRFGSDGDYYAYIADEETEIPEHYRLVFEDGKSPEGYDTWLWMYDDEDRTARFDGSCIKIFRAGDFGCIIQVFK